MPEHDLLTGFGGETDLRVACKVLAKIHDGLPVRGGEKLAGKALLLLDGDRFGGDEIREAVFLSRHRMPAFEHFLPGVVDFAELHVI